MIISISGVDGSGKSTQAEFIRTHLEKHGYKSDVLHLTQWTWVYKIGAKMGGKSSSFEKSQATANGLKSKLSKGMRQAVSLIDVFRFYFLHLRFQGKQVLVCDRYFYDLGIQAIYKNYYSERFVAWYWRLVPKPTVAFFLTITPSLAEMREGGEHQSDYYKQKRDLYGRFQPPYPLITIQAEDLLPTQNRIRVELDRVINEQP